MVNEHEKIIRLMLLAIAAVWAIWAMIETFNYRPQQPGANDIRRIYTQ
jgi:hypothetical protein